LVVNGLVIAPAVPAEKLYTSLADYHQHDHVRNSEQDDLSENALAKSERNNAVNFILPFFRKDLKNFRSKRILVKYMVGISRADISQPSASANGSRVFFYKY
jgi:hypothetical protein